ncbi:hypothetical protein FLAG1_09927 [Fusarium langsethiae]|uniref:Teneurin-like YD-shell domain-containing protein n=1 Tax=Fusarium langsethiae TaxID=179993 RepID=A0A0N0DBU3_FUSLA|nr:hypothetical protein FLAG1_09927 [Fusarium langsethiae]
MASGQFQGSHAFTRGEQLYQESVNPNTGSLTIKAPLVNLTGVRSTLDFKLSLVYSAGSLGTFGLPNNWGLDLPYVCGGKSLTTGGRTYVVDLGWSDSDGHKSGLRYVNNHGIVLTKVVPPLPLPSEKRGLYGWKLRNPDGSTDYLDQAGKPRERHDMYGNHLHLTYANDLEGGPDSPRVWLRSIQDSWGQQITFGHQPGSGMSIKTPNGGEIKVVFSNATGGVTLVTNPEGLKTSFEYVDFDEGRRLVSSVKYPSGLRSRYSYTPITYLGSDGSPHAMAAVQDHYQVSMSDNTVHRHDHYAYDVVKTVSGGDGKPLLRVRTWYNNLHLPTEEVILAPDVKGSFTETRKKLMTYDIDYERFARTCAYELPVQTEVFHCAKVAGKVEWVPRRRSKAAYNGYYNPVTSSDELYCPEKGYEKQSTVEKEYHSTLAGPQILKSSTYRDEVAEWEEHMESALTPDGKDISSAITTFRSSRGGDSHVRPWKHITYQYDAQGRLVGEELAWSPGASVPDDSAVSATETKKYEYQNGILTEYRSNAFGETETVERDMRIPLGPITRRVLPLGQTESFTYDAIGRVTGYTDALRLETKTSYATNDLKGSLFTIVTPMGYTLTTRLDMLNREVEATDNGDPTGNGTATSRTLWTKEYDALSRTIEERNHLGLATRHSYDELDRPLTTVDPMGNVVRYQYENGGLREIKTLNGYQRTVRNLNARLEALEVTSYADSGDAPADHCIVEEHGYDGRGNKIRSKLFRKTSDGNGTWTSTITREEVTEYGPENAVLSQSVTGYTDRGTDVVLRCFVLDLFGNVYTSTKDVTYADDRQCLGYKGGIHIFDRANRPILFRNQEGQEERHVYNKNGWITKLVRMDGTEICYNHDALGRITRTSYPDSQTTYVFDQDGRLTQTKEDGGTDVQYQYSLDGSLEQVTYGDGRKQTFELDQYSRATCETDACGVVQEITYNELGSVSRQSCGGDTVTYMYGSVNHTAGQALGAKVTGKQHAHLTELTHDGFNRVRRTRVRDTARGITLLDTNLTRDAHGRVTALTSTSEASQSLNVKRVFAYDGLGQLVEERRCATTESTTEKCWDVTKYQYDGNSNVVLLSRNDDAVTMTYNKIDQRTDSGIAYDTNGRMKVDATGQRYSFDARDRLLSVESSNSAATDTASRSSSTRFAYHADDFLAKHHRGDPNVANTEMYYSRGKINTMRSANAQEDGKEEEQMSFLSDSTASLVSSISNLRGKQYFLDQLGSTALIMQDIAEEETRRYTSAAYDAYGNPLGSVDSQDDDNNDNKRHTVNFGFAQELSDPGTGLVYLRSRYYSPQHLAFISMDSRRLQENRYTYCSGDPVNRTDPSGHSWMDEFFTIQHLASLALGLAVGIGASFIAGPVLGAAAAGALNIGAVSASEMGILAGAVATEVLVPLATGAVSGIAGGVAYSASMGEQVDGWDIAVYAAGGVMGEATATAVRPLVRPYMARLLASGKAQNLSKWGTRKLLGWASGKTTQMALQQIGLAAESRGFAGVVGAAGLTAAAGRSLSSPLSVGVSAALWTAADAGTEMRRLGVKASSGSFYHSPTAAGWSAEVWGSPSSLDRLG